MTLHWSAGYVGAPYADYGRDMDGCDCWGLVRMVLDRERQVTLPSYHHVSPDELSEIAAVIVSEASGGVWHPVEGCREFDVALFRRRSFTSHVGIMVDHLRMLHCDRYAGGARVERIDVGRWSSQFVGWYRHRDLI